ncbi:hypothetical protein [Myxococcus landrumensis]|uniref:Uncharacterized protein n=1 Tax=Myxococcus landrumensis TaxID=2813577 RepID=A0ABX7NIW0_9BACT|nr:hypothetical protein [Myxococcus landrumus]QSQ17482.1 hypothetical protein JY572_16195 [Myxococcus landrumus]
MLVMSGLDLEKRTCGEFLGKLIGRLFSKPGYIRPEDVPWLSALLGDFCEFEFNSDLVGAHIPQGKTRDLPLEFMKFYAMHWIESKHLQSAALQTLAVSALQVADAHLGGRPGFGQKWMIGEARLRFDTLPEKLIDEKWFYEEQRFKRDFTQYFGGAPLVAEIPPGGRLNFRRTGMGLAEGSVRFFLHRFHLSSTTTTIYDQVYSFETVMPPVDGYDLVGESLDGAVGVISFQGRPYNGRIPIGWIRGEYLYESNRFDQDETYHSLPTWLGFSKNLAPPSPVCSFSE